MSVLEQMMLWNCASIEIVDIRYESLQPYEQRVHSISDELFIVSAAGQARIDAGGDIYDTESAPVVHIGKDRVLRLDASTVDYECYLIRYKAQLPLSLPKELLNPQQAVHLFHSCYAVPVGEDASYPSMVKEMNRLWRNEHPLKRLEAKKQLYSFVYLLLKEWERTRESGGKEAGEPVVDPVAAAVEHMTAHYGEPLTLSDLAERLGTNPRQLQRGFKVRYGHSPMEHLISIRLEKAKKLLEQSELPIAQIAEGVGYPDSYYFSRLFKKYCGLSPRSYRQARAKGNQRAGDGCRISPSLASHTYIVPANEGGYHLKGSASQAFRALLSLTLLCTGGLTHVDGKIQVPHLRGTLELERRPERIAVLDYQYADQLLALGVTPVGSVACSVETGGLPADLAEPLSRMARLGVKEQPDLQALASLQPDLIIGTSFQEDRYADLSSIAPTIILDRNEDWRPSLFRLGELVGRQWLALESIDAYNDKLDRLRLKLKNGGGSPTVALIRPRGNSIRLHTVKHRTARLLYDDLELGAPPLAGQQTGTSSLIPLNTLPDLRADRLFVLTDDTNREQTLLYQQTPVWQSMNAVRSGQVRQVHTALWIGYYGPIAMNRVVDEIAEALL